MARLSVEHYRSNPGTPKTERKSSRFREIFKPRPSPRPSSSPDTLTNSPPMTSPLSSPTIKVGFEKIDSLPSERSSFETARRVRQSNHEIGAKDVPETQQQKLEGVYVPHDPGAALEDSAATEADEVVDFTGVKNGFKEPQSLAQLFKHSLSKHSSVSTDGIESQCQLAPSLPSILKAPNAATHHLWPVHDAASTIAFDTMPERQKSLDYENVIGRLDRSNVVVARAKDGRESVFDGHRNTYNAKDLVGIDHNGVQNTSTNSDGGNSQHLSLANNIFEDNDSLGQAIREHVANQIAEALLEHERKLLRQGQIWTKSPSRLNVNLHTSGSIKIDLNSTVTDEPVTFQILAFGPKSIGPITITHPRMAVDIQIAIVLAYLAIILGSALSGPMMCALTIWKAAVVLVVYAASTYQLGWCERMDRDILISPLLYVGCKLYECSVNLSRGVGHHVGAAIVDSLEVATEEAVVDYSDGEEIAECLEESVK